MTDWPRMMIGAAGFFIGWAANAVSFRLSERIESMVKSSVSGTAGQLEWASWFIAVAMFGFIAAGGIVLPTMKGAGPIRTYGGAFIAGAGTGGLIDELLNPPRLEKMVKG